jgi:hypothetical protein
VTRAASVIAPAPSLELRFSWPLIIAAAVFAYLIQQPTLLNDPDTYWHIKGRRMDLEQWRNSKR